MKNISAIGITVSYAKKFACVCVCGLHFCSFPRDNLLSKLIFISQMHLALKNIFNLCRLVKCSCLNAFN